MDISVYFGGCSITQGAGFPGEKADPRIYPNLVCASLGKKCDNDAEGGSSNLKIFTKAAKALVDRRSNIYVVQWSALHRHWLYPAPDQGFFISSDSNPDLNDRDRRFVAHFQLLNHDYGNIMSLIDYTRILTQMALDAHAEIFFVNGLITWSRDFLYGSVDSESVEELLGDLSKDKQINYFESLKNNMELVDWTRWVNPWESIHQLTVDQGPLGHHPGITTHHKIAELTLAAIDNKQRHI